MKTGFKALSLLVGVFLFVQFSGTSAFAEDVPDAALLQDPLYLTVDSVEMQDLTFLDLLGEQVMPPVPPSDRKPDDLDEAALVLDKIINLGKKVWDVVKASRPVVNVKTDVATALPEGVKGWLSLQGWQNPQSHLYRVVYKNLYGMSVVDFSFRVLFTPGGNVRGKGRYLCEATVIPAYLTVAWGYAFNAKTTVPTVLNVGSHEDPVGGIELRLTWSVDTVLKHNESSASFFVRGDGGFVDLTDGNR